MTSSEAQKRISALRSEVAHHDERYYRSARPEIGDRDYDRLKRELADLELKFPGAARAEGTDTPTARVGDDRAEGFRTVRHRLAMQSLDNTYSEAELREFHARLARLLGREDLSYVVEPKLDGLAVSLTYEKGRFVGAVTRGNGVEGDDVTANALTIRSLPRELKRSAQGPVPDLIEIRGEIYMTFAEFQRINARATRRARSATPTRAISRRERSSSSTRARSGCAAWRWCSMGSAHASPPRPAAKTSPATRPACADGACRQSTSSGPPEASTRHGPPSASSTGSARASRTRPTARW